MVLHRKTNFSLVKKMVWLGVLKENHLFTWEKLVFYENHLFTRQNQKTIFFNIPSPFS